MMKRSSALFAAAMLFLGASGCEKQCHEANDCLEANQCNGAPNLQRYTLTSGTYRVAQSDVGLDGCRIGRRNGDLNGLAVEITVDEAADTMAARIGNNIDLGSGKRNPQPGCNSATLSQSGVQGNIGGCTFSAAYSSQLILLANDQFYLSITEDHTELNGSCPISTKSCLLIYGATAR
jgi:hypothetical protein